MLEDWEKHVALATDEAWCGEKLYSYMWYFVNADHALRSVIQETRLQPCPACLTIIKKTIREDVPV